MKKWLAALVVILVVTLASCYIFIPNIVDISSEEGIHVTQRGLHRMLLDSANIARWWPGKKENGQFIFNDNQYRFVNNNMSLIAASIQNKEADYSTSIFIVSLATDSVHLVWTAKTATSYNPLKRFMLWQKAKQLNEDINTLLGKMKTFYSDDVNIYGLKIEKALVMDSILITTGAYSKEYPETEFIYSLIDKLKNYAAANGAKQTGYPMLNIDKTDTTDYNVRVAIPLDKILPDAGEIRYKRMLGLGNILVTEVKGGNQVTAEAFTQIELYAGDYGRTAPAIPFYSLITDRRQEPDSSKWITRVYFPVM